ncbi:GbsR/MarR family transcriptional regulator [Streptomyces winkii]|uniref:GbsR/MarR family transcriptional regulator n=1 Tax=Streptomyces winkii TaxID=3051178 RepID=UPI0028D5E6D5|nr:MarR family transcriptional regulator [Streptomyces sp. DSM 40971]
MTDERSEPGSEPEAGGYDGAASAFVERFAADMTEAGMQRMASRVFACLLASDDGSLSSAQLAERLRISPAAVSGAVRYLAQVHMVSREREPGSRRELYRVHENVWYEALLDRDQLLTRWTTTLRGGEQALGPDTPAGRRVRDTYEFLEFMQGELEGMLERWYARRAGGAEATPGLKPEE